MGQGPAQDEVIEEKNVYESPLYEPPIAVKPKETELMERITGKASDAPMCFTCGIKMRPSGSCYACEGCGSTSGCS